MVDLELSTALFFCSLPLLCFLLISFKNLPKVLSASKSPALPPSYPIIGSYFSISSNKERMVQWTSDLVLSSPSLTFVLQFPLGRREIYTANPSNVQHILKTRFHIYEKGEFFRNNLSDFLGQGIFNADGSNWKIQRQISVHEFNAKSLRKFVEQVVDTELSNRLIPILKAAADDKTVVDLQDIIQRFSIDNICKIACGQDPAYLLPSRPQTELEVAFETATRISSKRLTHPIPLIWKLKRALNLGSEKQLRAAINQIRDFAKKLIQEKKRELESKSFLDSVDLISRFLISGQYDKDFITDIIISFIFAGRDTTSAALTWFFWLISKNPEAENQILTEIKEKPESLAYQEVKDMIYTHASLCETMRLYPPVAVDAKASIEDDVLPDGTTVRKGDRVTYHPYAMGRAEKIWGSNWGEFLPERWLERDGVSGKWNFVARDSYTYPVFQAGPRICLGKDMAFSQMKMVVAGVLRRFKIVPAFENGVEPVFISNLTSKMKGGFPVRIVDRIQVSTSSCSPRK